jgi:hypothetical protein
MDLDSDNDKYYASQDSEDEKESCPPSRRSSISQPPSPDYSTSSSEDDDVGNVALYAPVGTDHFQQLHPFIFMWWEENLTQRFLTHSYQRDGGMGWA